MIDINNLKNLTSDGTAEVEEKTDNSLMIGLIVFIASLLTLGLVAAICACKQKCKDKNEREKRPRASNIPVS